MLTCMRNWISSSRWAVVTPKTTRYGELQNQSSLSNGLILVIDIEFALSGVLWLTASA